LSTLFLCARQRLGCSQPAVVTPRRGKSGGSGVLVWYGHAGRLLAGEVVEETHTRDLWLFEPDGDTLAGFAVQ
jgi:hypothetical protein